MKHCLSISVLLVVLSAVPVFSQADTIFRRCPDVPDYPYYHPKLRYEGDFWAIKKHCYEGFADEAFASLPDNTGIVTVHFWVNCHGQSGDFQVECCDFDYKPVLVNGRIVTRLLELVAGLNGWIPARFENGQVVNSHKFLSFRISKGKLTDILPQ